MEVPSVSWPEARAVPGLRVVDLRSPAEYREDHLPGAFSVPLLEDAQRAIVGTLYRKESPQAAMEAGLGMVEASLERLLEGLLGPEAPLEEARRRFRGLAERLRRGEAPAPAEAGPPPPGGLLLYCWRGGLRSRSVGAWLAALGVPGVRVLQGGYKAFRAWVRSELAAFDAATPLILLRGPTGVGKTRILQHLERALPGSTLDLEGLARHRSSILGDIGLEPAGARAFETGLADRLGRLGPPPWFVEGESRKVGDRVIPEPLWRAMEAGVQIRLDAPLSWRVGLLREEYLASPGAREQFLERLPFLEKRLGPSWAGRLREALRAGRVDEVAEVLLLRYYDIRYARSDRRRRFLLHLRADDPEIVPRLLELRSRLAAGAGNAPQTAAPTPPPACVDSSASPEAPAPTSPRSSTRA